MKETKPARKNNFDTTAQKKAKLPREEKKVEEEVNLESPTSVSMKNSLLIKHADPSFDQYASLKKRKTSYGYGANIFGLATATGLKGKSRCPGNRPAPRDGHSGIMYNNQYFLVFGGDRHHMPFNDLFALDLEAEFEKRTDL